MSRFSDLYTPKEVEQVKEVDKSTPKASTKVDPNQKKKVASKDKI